MPLTDDPALSATVAPTNPAHTVPADSLVGATVGNYRVVGLLGEGGMGKVYRAEHPEIGRQVAIKVVHALASVHPQVIARFRSEAMAVNKIGHPNIIDISDFGTLSDGRAYFVMEFLEGEDLGKRLARVGKMTPAEAAPIVAQTLDALAAAHVERIIHRDLKPDNIYLAKRRAGGPEIVKLLDFGVAKLRAENAVGTTIDGTLLGTPMYMSPEQAMGRMAQIGPASDLYAMGVILYQMLTGWTPFVAETVAALLVAHAHDEPVPPRERAPELDPRLEKIILRCLAKEPAARFHSANDLFDALAEVVPQMRLPAARGEKTRETTPEIPSAIQAATQPNAGAPPATRATEVAPPAERNRWAAAVLGAGVLALVAVGGALLWLDHRGPAPRAASEIAAPALPAPVLEG